MRIITKNGDNIVGGVHPNSTNFERIIQPFTSDVCPHGIFLHSEECKKECHLLIDDRLHIPNKNVSFLLEKKILGEPITWMDKIRPILCKIKHSKITIDKIVGESFASDNRNTASLLFGKNWKTHKTITSCKRCGIHFRKSVWDEEY